MTAVRNSRIRRTIFLMFIVVVLCPFAHGKIVYVDAAATGANDGSSWPDAYWFLQNALATAQYGDEIRVAQGIYKPDRQVLIGRNAQIVASGDRTATFQLINNVTIKGGYAGLGEPDPDARDIEAYETILSGDLNGNDKHVNNPQDLSYEPTRLENSYHVVTGSGTDETVVLDGFTVSAGQAHAYTSGGYSNPENKGGGMYNSSGSPTLLNCIFTENSADWFGGGMYNSHQSSPTVTNCTFSKNLAGNTGGGMFNDQYSSPKVMKCTFSENRAGAAGGMYNNYESGPALSNCIFIRNSANFGGGMYNNTISSPTLTNCTFSRNLAEYDGGGIVNYYDSNPTLSNCTFSGNSGKYKDGGGMFNFDSSPKLTNCAFSGNSAKCGGGMYNEQSNPTITNCTFNDNEATFGGGVSNDESSPTLTNCTFIGNLADHGGGMRNAVESEPMLINCTFSGNHASSRGGGLSNQFFSSPTLTNCNIIGNIAGVVGVSYGYGGGMFNRDGCNPLLINCIITGNLAKGDSGGGGGGGICTWNSKIDSSQIFINCSFAGNSAPRGNSLSYDSLDQDFPSTVRLTNCILWDGYNQIWNRDHSQINITYSDVQVGGRFPWPGEGNINADPLFVNAASADYHLQPSSPCIDAGDNSAIPPSVVTDLDGNPRIINGTVDIGAYEGGATPPPDVYYVDAVNGDNNNDGLSFETAFATIQKGIDAAKDGDTVLVYPGVYTGEINFLGKAIRVQGIATKAGISLIENPGDFAVSFYYGEGPDSVLKNFIIKDSFMGVFIAGSSPTISNLTIVDNKYGIEAYAGSEPDISNTILWNNTDGDLFQCQARYSCIERGVEGEGNITDDPLFVDPDSGDYHLYSERGRYWPEHDVWVLDEITSPCVDGGDPTADYSGEPMPNGGCINMGAYGGTAYASMSEMRPGLNYPPVVTITSPEDGAEFAWGLVPIKAYAWDVDGVVVKVEFFANGGKIGEDNDGSDGWATEWSDFTVGEYELIARATDNDGASTDSTAIEISATPPPPPKGRACFLADTPVWVNGALVQISNVVSGQMVGEPHCGLATECLEQIETVEEHEGTFECRDIVLESGNRISVVDAHCFMLDSGQWIAAQDLRSGLRLKTLSGTVGIKSVATRAAPFVGKVYNLKVTGADRYLVSEDGVIVRDY